MKSGMWGLLGVALVAGCGGDEDAGGSSYGGSASQTTQQGTDATTGTTAETPTTSASVTATDGTTSASATDTDGTTTTTGPAPLVVDCGTPPGGAQGATYKHQPAASGGVPGYKWSATGLPPGLMIHPNTGLISGAPSGPGDFAVEITVEDVQGTMAMTTCPSITIADQLAVDYDGLFGGGPCVVAGGKTILDYVSGGDGSPISCSVPGGLGNGALPMGLAVDPDSCAIVGAIAETRYGGWAWMVAAQQSGVTVYAPYCATQAQQAPKAYDIVGSHSGKTDNELEPLVVKFAAGDPLLFDGDADPLFEVTKGVCGDSCFFGFLYKVSQSPLGTGACKSDKDGCFGLCPLVADPNQPDGDTVMQCSLLPKMGTPKIGFAHEMWAKGDVAPAEFQGRPFIVQWSVDYCLSSTQADCQGKDAILANGAGSNLEFPVIFRPQ